MGTYTEIYVNIDLKENTPQDVIDILEAICLQNNKDECLEDKPDKWLFLFKSCSYYTPNTQCGILTFDQVSKQYSLLGKGDIKNYDCEIEKFFAFLKPHTDNYFIGYFKREDELEPKLVYNELSEERKDNEN